jgi:D-3-phosphoglycerate dehydrogenase
MRLLVADKFSERQLQKLADRGHDVRYEPRLDAAGLVDAIADAEILVVRSTEVTRAAIESARELSLIIRAGSGTNNIDVEAASERAIYVSNVRGKNSVAVAELTMGLIVAVDRRIPDNVVDLRAEQWRKSEFSRSRGLMGRRIGIIGLGSVGLEVARRARAFGMKVVGLERDRDEEQTEELAELGVKLYPDLASLLPRCDIVTLHVPSTPETKGMVNAGFLSLMKDGAYLINTSRGDVVVAEDLLAAIEEKGLWAALDVFPNEPEAGEAEFVSELAQHPHVYGTHHIGASTDQAQEAVARKVVEIVDRYAAGVIDGVVNLAAPMAHTTVVGIRHADQVGVLSRVFAVLRDAGLNVEQMENHVFAGAKAAKAVIHLYGDFNEAVRKELEDLDPVFHVAVLRETELT